ncbi:hypothetical protein ABET51_06605 [Metabacillus fastidiosus]|uniref:phage lytic cycle repressor MrpR family protein n=1 Tax=Metabacillus fastidiosus TaxID=1458 RepID=UPI003D27DF4D
MQTENIYNYSVKEQFLENFSDETKSIYSSVFRKTNEHEMFVEKDLFQFSLSQLEMLMRRLDFINDNAAKTYGRVISSYLNWSIEVGLRKEENPLKSIGNEWFERFVNKIKLFISEEELINIEEKLVNYQDKVILRLLFEGVGGSMLSELTNLTIHDVEGNSLYLNDSKHGKRTLSVSDKAIKFIREASKENEYYTKNGNSTGRRTVSALIDSDYIIKSTVNKNAIDNRAVDRHQIYRRLSMIEVVFSLQHFNAKSYQKSGMLKMAKDLYLDEGELKDEQLEKISKRFSVKNVIVNGVERKDYSYLKQFINIENIRDLYNID